MMIDGILGMSPYDSMGNPNPYVKTLYDQGEIEEAVVTFQINLESQKDSKVTFGGIPDGIIDGETQTFDIVNDSWWTVNITGLSYDGNSIKRS